jgi:hypothetical protein
MRRTLILSGAFALVAPSILSAQNVRWNDRPTATWSDEAPRIRVTIEGPRAVPYGYPMRVRFEVSDNAFATVVRVDDDGRMTILFPYARTQRAAVRAGQVYYARNPRLGGEFSFIANDRMGGYIVALASYAPLDFSSFENRDYERIGGYSRFTVANRSIARRPDVFVDRFAARVLWDVDTPYDYDVDYYFPVGYPGMSNAYALCGGSALGHFYGTSAYGYPFGWNTYLSQLSSWDRMAYPYLGMCRDWYGGIRCYSAMALYSYYGCDIGSIVVTGPPGPIPGQPVDTANTPNEGVVRGGLFAPTPLPVGGEGTDPPPVERLAGRFDQTLKGGGAEWDNLMSIPERATRKMKEQDAARGRDATGGVAPARTALDGAATDKSGTDKSGTDKSGKTRTASADGDAATRVQPPSREPTKAKGVGEPRRETASKGGFGSPGRTSEPRTSGSGPDRVSRPVDTKSTGTANPPSIQGTTTEKKKPPKN